MFIGVDIGGTFTDLVVSQGVLRIHKLLSTPQAPQEAMLAGLQAVGMQPGARVAHGSTVATNAILERKGARTALLVTQGFRDILAIGRQNRPNLYALQPHLPAPLIPRQWCYDVPERLDFHGQILQRLDIQALDAILDDLQAQAIEAIAVCLLYSFVNPVHEQAIQQRILERGFWSDWQLSLSHQVLPQFREYERASTVALDAYVRPKMNRYLADLENALPPQTQLLVMKSDGGLVSAAKARQEAVQTALSGPSAGLIGAFHLAKLAGYDHIITLDMGGTSTDVALCAGSPAYRPEASIDGLPLRLPMLDIETVGAGGGSLVRVDAGGALRVGPDSAGASPGPIIYGRGATQLTVSDANALLGRLDSRYFLGGQMALHLAPAQVALTELAQQVSLTPHQTALGILQIANTTIERAVRRVSVGRGHDPRHFTLMAFGGAGGLHACEVAERLQIRRVLIPRYPGVMCALGLLLADIQREYSRAILQPFNSDLLAHLQQQAAVMKAQAQNDLTQEGIALSDQSFHALVDMRYQGQSYELPIPLGDSTHDPTSAFHQAHQKRYGHAMPQRPLEVVNLRLQAIGRVEKPTLPHDSITPNDAANAYLGHKTVEGETIHLYQRESFIPGAQLNGPALIFQLDGTTYLPAGWSGQVDGYFNLILQTH
jgi:N-methylhydantoinase A